MTNVNKEQIRNLIANVYDIICRARSNINGEESNFSRF